MNITKAICAITLLGGSLAHGQGTLDQVFDPSRIYNLAALNFNGASHGQTFTVGRSGYLSKVDVFIGRWEAASPQAEISWNLRSTSAGVPVGGLAGVLASGKILFGSLSSSGYSFQPCQISSYLVPVNRGEVFAITLSSDYQFVWGGSDRDYYPAGSHQVGSLLGPWRPNPGTELGFKTFVEPVPEPSTIALLSLGCCVFFTLLTCRRTPA